jgi:hypothetical protein
MKAKLLVLVIVVLVLITTASCKNNLDEDESSQSTPSSQFTSSSAHPSYNTIIPDTTDSTTTPVSTDSYPSIVFPPTITLSTASIPRKYEYIPVGEDRVLAKTIIAEWKSNENDTYDSVKEYNGGRDVKITADNAFITYGMPNDQGNAAMEWVDILRETRDIHALAQKSHKRISYYLSIYDASEDNYKYAFWRRAEDGHSFTYMATADTAIDKGSGYRSGFIKAMNQLFNSECFEQLKIDLGVKEIKEILYFENVFGESTFYYNTDKGEYVYAFSNYGYEKNDKGIWVEADEIKEWYFRTLDEYIEEQTVVQAAIKKANGY